MQAHSEAAFESLIELHLLEHGGYLSRPPGAYDRDLALIPEDLLAFVRETQAKVWSKQEAIHGDRLGANLITAFAKVVDQKGVLRVLREGFKFYGSTVRVAAFQPAHGLNPEVERLYEANRLAVVRQLHFDPKKPSLSLDLVLFLNGIPVVTAELKNAMTSQSAEHAKRQYQQDRDPQAPIFRFKRRALVHFAVGSDEVWMSTRLAKGNTYFLPFNLGDGTGKGNPKREGKHRTWYLWEQVWQRDSLLDILARFMHLQSDEEGGKERMIFPRYHQLRCVRRLVAESRVHGAGRNYLVQHSAGSGKSNSIAWLAHRLSSLHDTHDRKVYDSVVVITDRQVLDQQLQKTIAQFDHKDGVVQKIDKDSQQLATALETGVPIIVSTIHKFGFISDKVNELPGKRYAVIVDEAHSSQSGDMAKNMKAILGASSIAEKFEEEAEDVATPDQAALRAALARGPQKNLSFFAFTATPKFKTLELFGHVGEDGKPAPFDLYSMRQAIEEEFILDVLRGYTTYKRYFKLVKAVADDPDLDKKKASRALARFVSLHPVNIAQKTEVIIEHFRSCVMRQLDRQAKAMVVTGSRLHAVRYKLAFDKYLAEQGYTDVGALVAFSGEVVDPDNPATVGAPYTEPQLNIHRKTGRPIGEKELPAAFDGPHYNVLIVANKYQTGFDQPLLVAMYVDKRLAGIQAVQTLSRLNRTTPGKRETFVLDFVNEREEILESFQDYYEGTTVAESIDPQRLYELSNELQQAEVYTTSEVNHFADHFFKVGRTARQLAAANGRLNAALDPAKDRFAALDEEEAETFRGQLSAYCNLYSFLGQVVPFHDVDLEKLYVFGKMLLNALPKKGEGSEPVDVTDDVGLHYYRLQKQAEGDLTMVSEGVRELYGPGDTGTGLSKDEKEKLSTLIELLNDRFGTEWDKAKDLVDAAIGDMEEDSRVLAAARANESVANFAVIAEPLFEAALLDRNVEYGDFLSWLYEDKERRAFVLSHEIRRLHAKLRGVQVGEGLVEGGSGV